MERVILNYLDLIPISDYYYQASWMGVCYVHFARKHEE